MSWNLLQKIFGEKPSTVAAKRTEASGPRFRVVVADFYDNVSNRGAVNLAQCLQQCEGIDVCVFAEDFDHSFLNLESRNIFDLIDTGQTILRQTRADVLIWGYRENNRIRLNFQNPIQYEEGGNSFISLMDSFYLPAEMLDDEQAKIPPELMLLLYGTVISAVNKSDSDCQVYKKYLLKKNVHSLSQLDSAQAMGLEYMPYLFDFLGIIYLSLAYDSPHDGDLKIIRSLFENALKYQEKILQPTHLGCIYYHLGQMYDCATHYLNNRPSSYFRPAIKNYQTAQKYFSKYTYPYDYGYVCYKLSGLYVSYWKQTEDIQALRDAVFQLREAEKVYTQVLFPDFWGRIEGGLGYLLYNLGYLTGSQEICNLAITAYKNQQKIITEKKLPLQWAIIQEKIGNINYLLGRNHYDLAATEEAFSCFHDALYIYETQGDPSQIKRIKSDISRAYQLLEELRQNSFTE